MRAALIRVRGTVQGVGFRPTVWRLARECGVTGHVLNDAEGVLIRAFGARAALHSLAARLRSEAPPLCRIDALECDETEAPASIPTEFHIVASVGGMPRTAIAADAATCPACLQDVRRPGDRRYRYPFTNCTHCGPRLSIVRAMPYDRASTSMAAFPMCAACRAEYEDPADRRFHAQPNACPHCGPVAWLEDGAGSGLVPGDRGVGYGADGDDPLGAAARRIRAGDIVAIKGLGGFHLACDARNADAVARLRRLKHRPTKPLALMAADMAMVRRYAAADEAEEVMLASAEAPVVLLRAAGEPLPAAIAPGQDILGFMLPNTALHHILLADLDAPVVLTSGNRSDEPQVTGNEEARQRLAGIADCFLMHDRDIVNRLDDSVTQVAAGAVRVLRRGRGYAPAPLPLPAGFEHAPQVLAMGGELKNTFCVLGDGRAILSPHIGDMETAHAIADYRRCVALYRDLYEFSPDCIAVDPHPDYVPTRLGLDLAAQACPRDEDTRAPAVPAPTEPRVEVVRVQHHHAHAAAVMLEHGLALDTAPVLAITLDGHGLGADGRSLWGGEFLLADYREAIRLASLPAVPLPGAAQAVREPWRNAWAHLDTALGWGWVAARYGDVDAVRWLSSRPLATLAQMVARGINSPRACSTGRLFDAVAALVCAACRERQHHEAQAAMALEALARPHLAAQRDRGYPIGRVEAVVDDGAGPATLDLAPMWQALLDDLRRDVEPGVLAARFHVGLTHAVAALASDLASAAGITTLVLGGGAFHNRVLLEGVDDALRSRGWCVLSPQRVPAGDGGLALGQAAVAAARHLPSPPKR